MSYTVAQRTNEVGIRMALGARRSHVLAMVLRESIALALAGILIGVPAALAVAPVVENRLFRVGPSDPAAIGGAALLMIVVAVAAGMVPARHASRRSDGSLEVRVNLIRGICTALRCYSTRALSRNWIGAQLRRDGNGTGLSPTPQPAVGPGTNSAQLTWTIERLRQ
jgi:hypothetical protein